jgi:hypothetical protein
LRQTTTELLFSAMLMVTVTTTILMAIKEEMSFTMNGRE